MLVNCLTSCVQITIFQMDEDGVDIDRAILRALLKGLKRLFLLCYLTLYLTFYL